MKKSAYLKYPRRAMFEDIPRMKIVLLLAVRPELSFRSADHIRKLRSKEPRRR
jgi:hypothetical protein